MTKEKRPYIVGLTGGIASGKTAASDYLKTLGAVVFDADVESRLVTAAGGEALPLIRDRFGEGVFTTDGELDRRALGQRVFSNGDERRALEEIIHPLVIGRMEEATRRAARAGENVVFWSVPLLFESGMDRMCDETWVMTAEKEERLRRLIRRDRLTKEEAMSRINSQMAEEERRARGDVLISTGRGIGETRRELEELYWALKGRLALS